MSEYELGAQWNVTVLDGKTIVWIQRGYQSALVSIADPDSTDPARRLLGDFTSQPIADGPAGLTVYGTHVGDRPSFAAARLLSPAYAYLIGGLEEGRGITQHDFTN